ncbi:MAG: hypothetical protein Q7S96_01390 [bacterium]|nr:hypothetical protein [bacterium]
MLTPQTQRRNMLSIHNRTTNQALIALALVVIFAGAGCDLRRSAVPVGDVPANGSGDTTEDDDTTNADATTIPAVWATHDSPALGLRVPYPEGWYVEERSTPNAFGEISSSFHSTPAPSTATEYPAEAWIARTPVAIDDIIAKLDAITIDENVDIASTTMRHIMYNDDFYSLPMSLYLWQHDGYTMEVGGIDANVVLHMVSSFMYR